MTAWPEVLDAFAARLDAVAAAADAGGSGTDLAAVPPFAPPAGLGPLPIDQVVRATVLLERAGELEQRLRRARDVARTRLAAPAPRPTRAATADPAYLDLAV